MTNIIYFTKSRFLTLCGPYHLYILLYLSFLLSHKKSALLLDIDWPSSQTLYSHLSFSSQTSPGQVNFSRFITTLTDNSSPFEFLHSLTFDQTPHQHQETPHQTRSTNPHTSLCRCSLYFLIVPIR